MSVGERIKAARSLRDITLRSLGESIGKTHTAVSRYEKGTLAVSSGVLMKVAEALDMPVEYFLRTGSPIELEPVFRKQRALSAAAMARVLAEVSDWVERYAELRSLLANVEWGSLLPPGFPLRVSTPAEVEKAAQDLREQWEIGLDAISGVVPLLESRGIVVIEVQATEKFLGCSMRTGGRETEWLAVVTRLGMDVDRQRFTLCHELGHLALDPVPEMNPEVAAHRFAGAFLVPESVAKQELWASRKWLADEELLRLKQKYGMSMGAWVRRAQDLGIITAQRAGRIYAHLSKRGWKTTEPSCKGFIERPQRFEQLIVKAVTEKIISERKAEELLRRPYCELLAELSESLDGVGVGTCR